MSTICAAISPFLSLGQQLLNILFGWFTFFGLAVPNFQSLINSALGCTA